MCTFKEKKANRVGKKIDLPVIKISTKSFVRNKRQNSLFWKTDSKIYLGPQSPRIVSNWLYHLSDDTDIAE